MRIDERDTRIPRVYTEQEIKHAHEIINQWEAVDKTMKSPGWKILIDFFQSQLQMFDSISNAKLDDFQYRQGLVDGLKELLQSPKNLKQNATSAINFLKEAELADTEE